MEDYRVKILLDYEVPAESKDEAVNKVAECIHFDLSDGVSLYDIADIEVGIAGELE